MSEREYTREDLAAAWEMGWQSARDNYTALYAGKPIPGTVRLMNPFNYDAKITKKAGAGDE